VWAQTEGTEGPVSNLTDSGRVAAEPQEAVTDEASAKSESDTVEEAVPAEVEPPSPVREEPSGKSGFSAFRIITERNIFDGNRSGQRISSTRSSSLQRSVRVDAFSLVGTMISAKGPVAFFDGTESGYREALKPGQRIAGFDVREVRYSGVRLAQGTNTIDLAVGTGMRRENGGLWKPSSGPISFASSSSGGSEDRSGSYSDSASRYSSRSSSRNGSRSNGGGYRDGGESFNGGSSPSAPPTAEVNEVLKRLMEQRDKE